MQLVKSTDTTNCAVEQPPQLQCLNGPCQGAWVDTPIGVTPGTATALRWQNIKNADRYAVYVVVNHNGMTGLMYLKSYNKPFQAVQRVNQITAICEAAVS